MKPRGFRTQCDTGGCVSYGATPCPETIVLAKPAHWRCPKCVKLYGPIVVKPDPIE